MAVTYNLLPIPKWYFADKAGRPLAGGFMFTYSSLTRQPKIVYQDLGGTLAWTNPVIFDANGTQGPFYWAFNSAAPTDLYFIEIYDADLVLQWTIDNYGGPGSGGGSVVTTTTSIKNLVANNVFYRNLGTSALGLAKNVTLAPGAHSGLAGNAFPDINFIKDSTAASDQITFTAFPFGTNPVPTDITPPYYLSYVCNNIAGDEGIKVVRYPITANVKNLENQAVTISFWARRNPASGSPTIAINSYQFFGDGPGATTAFRQPLMSYDLSTIPGWNKYVLNTTIPSASTKTVGACGNSALFLEFAYPINAACNIDHTKLSLYAATLTGTPDFDTFDQIESLVNSARTGDIRTSMNSFQPFGWVSMNDGTIGSATSGGTTRANVDTFPLFSTLYLNVIDTYAPVSGGRTGAGARGSGGAGGASARRICSCRAVVSGRGSTPRSWARAARQRSNVRRAAARSPLSACARMRLRQSVSRPASSARACSQIAVVAG